MNPRRDDESPREDSPAEWRGDSVAESNQSVEITSVSRRITWRAPIPQPDAMERYDRLLPGAAERILRRWEKQSDHRMHVEKTRVESDSRRSDTGLIFAFILSLLIIALGAYAVIWGNPWVGVAVIGINIAGLAGVFVYGTNARRRERERKASEPRA